MERDAPLVREAVARFLARARAERGEEWVDDATLAAHALAHHDGPDAAALAETLDLLHAGDLKLSLACARGSDAAIAVLEAEHFARVRQFSASVDPSPSFVTELTQQLRARLLLGEGGAAPRIASYSGRGSLGGWIRVAAVRLARDISRGERAIAATARNAEKDRVPLAVDPEIGLLKERYGDAVSTAFERALAALEPNKQALLKMHYVDGLSIEQVGAAFGVSRATSARMLADARSTLLERVREQLALSCNVRGEEADSLLAFVRSRIDVSLGRVLGPRT